MRRRVPSPRRGFAISASTKRMLIAATVLAVVVFLVYGTAAFWINWWWFGSIGYRGVLTARYQAEVVSFLGGAAVAVAVIGGNIVYALRRSRASVGSGRIVAAADRLLLIVAGAATVVVGVVFGLAASARWQEWLLWLHGRDFGTSDPVFHRDAGFYVFVLPALQSVQSGGFTLLLLTTIAVAVVYALRLGVNLRDFRGIPAVMRIHLVSLIGVLLALVAARNVLDNYLLVYSERGVVFGTSYTDVHAQRIANWVLAALTVAIAGLLVLNVFVRRFRWLVAAAVAWAVLSVLLGLVIPAAVQRVVVVPSELARERPYISDNLAMTRTAYGLGSVETKELSGQAPLAAADLAKYPTTLANVRLWDYRIIRTTYQQLQSFVPYYLFRDVDVERYAVNGGIQQVVLSARELDSGGLPATAQTWTNQHLVYTHGTGVVVSPVGEVSAQGLPIFRVGQIPPSGTGVFQITRPEIYFGEAGSGWIAVHTNQPEFSGLPGSGAGSGGGQYQGQARGSIKLNNFLTKLMTAANLGDRNILFSGSLTGDSRILLRRNIVDRTQTIAPFLKLDPDPYLVIADGRLYWIIDAYTHTDRYPDAPRTRGVNYLRNSVKVVIDAYDGTTTFYRTAEPDPIADAWGAAYDHLFQPVSAAPPGITAQFRYPELLFDVQSDIYASFHVADPTAYYNGEDRWAVPLEQVNGTPARMEPYYVTMTLPGASNPDFALIRPFTPGGNTNRQNMTAWLAGRADATGRSALALFHFPRQETVFGPSQVEARIDQEPDISAQITLWNQSGSKVIRGNLLVIPIGESVLYVQPLYLQATNSQGALPELKRVIVASSEKVVMRATLSDALAALTGAQAGGASPPGQANQGGQPATNPAATGNPTVERLTRQALDAFQTGQAAVAKGDWTTFGKEQDRLAALLKQLADLTGNAPSAPGATPAASPGPTVSPSATPTP